MIFVTLVIVAAAAAVGAVLWSYLAPGTDASRFAPPTMAPGELRLGDLLGGDLPEGAYRLALDPIELRFPRDHGPHPGFRSEWWYFTGNLATAQGRRFGYQLTVFRFEVAREPLPPAGEPPPDRPQLYLGHFALTDVAAQRFHHFERTGREVLGTAGAQAAPFRVWLDGWEMTAPSPESGPDGMRVVRLRASEAGVGIDLTLHAVKPVIPQGRDGLSQKSREPGAASYYYSVPRWRTAGEVRIAGERWRVEGLSWLDREWSTSALGPEQVGWDWFAFHLDDGTDLMFYALRTATGERDPLSAGTLVAPDGRRVTLAAGDVRIDVQAHWASPTGGRYPARWRLAVRYPPEGAGGDEPPGLGPLELEVVPLVPAQLWRGRIEYWEGAVRISGRRGGVPVAGHGYVELTGYGDAGPDPRVPGL